MPQAIGALVLAAVNYGVAEVGGVVASEAFIAPFATTGFYAEAIGTLVLNAVAIGANMAVAPGRPKPGISKVNIRHPVAPRCRYYGAYRVADFLPSRKEVNP